MATPADILEMRRNPQMMTSDGFSPDRTSYSVANDFGKLWGDAMANYEARLNNPKYLPGSFNPNLVQQPPDKTPQQLQAEYLNPVLERFGGRPAGGSAKTYHLSNDDILAVNPDGTTKIIYQSPDSNRASVSSKIPESKTQIANWFANSPTMRAEESAALDALNRPGADPFDILGSQYPTLLKNSPYAERFGPIYRAAATKHNAIANAPVENISPNVSVLAAERARLAREIEGTPGAPPSTIEAYTNRINQIDSIIQSQEQSDQGDELVPVINPKGQNKRIKASDLERAVKMGYRQR